MFASPRFRPATELNELPAISVVGLGYVGAVSTACLASLGHKVVGVDIDATKVAQVAGGVSPIHEKDLGQLLDAGVRDGLISATPNLAAAIAETDVTFVSVGTPTAADGGCDHTFLVMAARQIGAAIAKKRSFHTVVMRCSIPPGTTEGVMVPEIEAASGLTAGEGFGIAFNPEFLREGVAVADFRNPPKTVIGVSDNRTADILKAIYAPVDEAIIVTSIEVAEMVKYVDNVWHATKVTFGNEVGRLCKPLGIDSHKVMDIFVRDTKLNLSPYYLKPGFAFGGSCLPKEVRAVRHMAQTVSVNTPLINSLIPSNEAQVVKAIDMVLATGAKQVAVFGLAFKPGTDDLRESPALEVVAALVGAGVTVRAYDPAITDKTPIAAQLAYVKHSGTALGALVDELPGLLRPTAQDAAEGAEAFLFTQANPQLRAFALDHPNTPIIDVVRLFADQPDDVLIDGIGW